MAVTGKKGVFFTLAAVLLLLALAMLVSLQSKYRQPDRAVVETRISTMSDFVGSIEKDMERGLYISAFRAVLSMEEFVSQGSFLNDSGARFQEAVLTGSIHNRSMVLMQNSTLPDWAARVSGVASGIALIVNISFDSVSVRQSGSWALVAESNMTINVTDTLNTASWSVNSSASALVSIIGLEDPFFVINTQGRALRVINSSPFEGNYVVGNNTANLVSHIAGFYYTNSTGPDFLMRFEGNYSGSPFGIETFVNVPELQQKGVSQYERSMVDYVYFGNLSTAALYRVNNTYENWLLIDDAHLAKYQVQGVSYQP
ncbi:hypothetical protein HY640_03510 [Candidatus Woesearchaeota archaeon]|nr:hypothetical protein [Candidatus Woesearchaeota archaeon]